MKKNKAWLKSAWGILLSTIICCAEINASVPMQQDELPVTTKVFAQKSSDFQTSWSQFETKINSYLKDDGDHNTITITQKLECNRNLRHKLFCYCPGCAFEFSHSKYAQYQVGKPDKYKKNI
ncbi:MAG: hypothetical protein KUG73_16230 [Pseudomonadales bacterium]|nr:hypothetical protein [Pseudomonadales bacterium]